MQMPLAVTTVIQAPRADADRDSRRSEHGAGPQGGPIKDQPHLGSNLPKPVRLTEPPRATMSVISLSV